MAHAANPTQQTPSQPQPVATAASIPVNDQQNQVQAVASAKSVGTDNSTENHGLSK